jgi:hypothetical protein
MRRLDSATALRFAQNDNQTSIVIPARSWRESSGFGSGKKFC